MKKILIIFILFTMCLSVMGCSMASVEDTRKVYTTEISPSITTEEANNQPPDAPPTLCIDYTGERLEQLRSLNLNDEEKIYEFLTVEEFTWYGFTHDFLCPQAYSEEEIYEVINFLRMIKIPEIKGADLCGVYIIRPLHSDDSYTDLDFFDKILKLKYRFREPVKQDVYKYIELQYPYTDGVTLEQLFEKYSWIKNDEIITCGSGSKAICLSEVEDNFYLQSGKKEIGKIRGVVELEGYYARIDYRIARTNTSADFSGVSGLSKEELLDILKNDVTFTPLLATNDTVKEENNFNYDLLLQMPKEYIDVKDNAVYDSLEQFKAQTYSNKDVFGAIATIECIDTAFYITVGPDTEISGKTVSKCKIVADETFNDYDIKFETIVEIVQNYYLVPTNEEDVIDMLESFGAEFKIDSMGCCFEINLKEGDYVLQIKDGVSYTLKLQDNVLPMEPGVKYTGAIIICKKAITAQYLLPVEDTQRYDSFQMSKSVMNIATEIKNNITSQSIK